MTIFVHQNDLPNDIIFKNEIAIDTETQGLSLVRDKLCLVQLSGGDGDAHIVQINRDTYECPHLKKILTDSDTVKIFHFARFDMAILKRSLGINVRSVFCTKIASSLIRTYTNAHGLKALVKEYLNIDLSKHQQSSDWATPHLSKAQIEYAASDVLYLHVLKQMLSERLLCENRLEMANECFAFLSTRIDLDLQGWDNVDVFSHNPISA